MLLTKFPLFLREVICPQQLQSEDPLAANLLFKDRHFLRVALRVPGRAPVEVAIGAGLAGNPFGAVPLVVVPTLLREQCFALSSILQDGFFDESSGRSLAGAALGMGDPPEVSGPLARGALCNLAGFVSEDVLAAMLGFKDRRFYPELLFLYLAASSWT